MKTETRGIIFSGGDIRQDFALDFLEQYRKSADRVYVIAADRGLAFCQDHHIAVDAIVGDFDSADRERLKAYGSGGPLIRLFQPEKDWTDTELAADLALEEGLTKTVLIGGTGTRLDHVLGNIQVMDLMLSKGMQLQIVDPHNRITLHRSGFRLAREDQWGRYVSLIAWGGPVTGLTLRGFKYPVQDFTLTNLGSRAISNEIAAPTADVSFAGGKLLVIESRD